MVEDAKKNELLRDSGDTEPFRRQKLRHPGRATKIFLPNSTAEDAAQKELYVGMGLNDKQINILKTSEPKRDYYIISPQGRRKVQLALKGKALAFVGASDKESLARIRALAAEYGPEGWQAVWLREHGAA